MTKFQVICYYCMPSLIWMRRKVVIAALYVTFMLIGVHILHELFLDFLDVILLRLLFSPLLPSSPLFSPLPLALSLIPQGRSSRLASLRATSLQDAEAWPHDRTLALAAP